MTNMKPFKLENEPKIETGFKIPDNYFENFSDKVLQQLSKEEPKVISIFPKKKFYFMTVAAILILALAVPIYITFSTKTKELDDATLENYLSYQSNLNQYDLISELEPEDIVKMQPKSTVEDQTLEDILTANADVEHLVSE